jgi:uncharacterized Ntn-hydrolase superfamily protein
MSKIGAASLLFLATFLTLFATNGAAADSVKPLRPVHTYSIVARDAATGELGAAVQSHWFSVGSNVIWAEPGIGAVATQSFIEPSYGPLGLQLMRSGKTAEQALTSLLAADAHENVRQVGMVDAAGTVSNHTGDKAIIEFCDMTGHGFAVQANLMWKPTVCSAMFDAYKNAEGDLAERMLIALEAAEGEGGDVRGKQSVALLVVSGDIAEPAWGGRIFDLRIEDHVDPLTEMRRLLTMARAYRLAAPRRWSPTATRWCSGMPRRWPPTAGSKNHSPCSRKRSTCGRCGGSWFSVCPHQICCPTIRN